MRFNSALQEMNHDLDFSGWCHRRPGDRGGNLEPRLPADEVNGAALAIHAAYTLRLFYKSASLAPTGCADHGQRTSGSTPGRQVDDVLCVRLAKDQHQAHAVSSWAPLAPASPLLLSDGRNVGLLGMCVNLLARDCASPDYRERPNPAVANFAPRTGINLSVGAV
jgi:hypothetical protein